MLNEIVNFIHQEGNLLNASLIGQILTLLTNLAMDD